MAGTFILGETKIRPGAYFNIQKTGTNAAEGTLDGVTAVLFKADFGPLNEAVELSVEDGYEGTFGTELTTDAIREAFAGGARTVIACRIGEGGSKAAAALKEAAGDEPGVAVNIEAAYPGSKPFTITVREKLSDSSQKECVIYTGTSVFESVTFPAGEGEAQALADALAPSRSFKASVVSGKANAVLANVSQQAFTAGTNPVATNGSYSNGFAIVEAFEFNTICVDTSEASVHLLLQAFVNRIFDAGSLTQAVVAEGRSVALDTRIAHAAAFNDEKVVYVLNAHVSEQGTEIDGYQTAARVAGMIGAVSAGSSLTHTVVSGFSELLERLPNTQMIAAEKKGCLVMSLNSERQVWIDNAINTLITPADNQDDGWKKIRRTKTRFELIRRMNRVADSLIGKVSNSVEGRAAAIDQLQAVADAMVEEGKLVSCTVEESGTYKADGDSVWLDINVVDLDSLEHAYLTFHFQFSTNV